MINLHDFGLVPWATDIIRVGDKHGSLTVLAIGKLPISYRYFAVCACDCGAPAKKVRLDKLMSGHTTSCGCAQRKAVTTHGLHRHTLYPVWRNMHSRCYNPIDKRFEQYGGRGITVCERWRTLTNFIEDMDAFFFPGATIDRIDNDQGYSPDNCRWATLTEQANNKSCNVLLTHHGETLTLSQWAERTGLCYGTLWERLKVLQWPAERVLETPPLSPDERCALARESRKKPYKSSTC